MRNRILVIQILGCLACLFSELAAAGDLSDVAGHYRYEEYNVSLPNGRVLHLSDLGATDAFLDISPTGTITLRMTMKVGNTVTQTAKVVEAHFVQGKGYWIAQWPDMSKPVKAQIVMSAQTLTTDTSFDDRSDVDRYGAVEHAVLRKANGT
jgi:hypothetical protein